MPEASSFILRGKWPGVVGSILEGRTDVETQADSALPFELKI